MDYSMVIKKAGTTPIEAARIYIQKRWDTDDKPRDMYCIEPNEFYTFHITNRRSLYCIMLLNTGWMIKQINP